ncbi:MAG: YXWGXW repeat-containing protein [Planctomycetaceae bacterium]|nr:YXWGXW repeat-containing protein [Planctomycetaceae bacterium]
MMAFSRFFQRKLNQALIVAWLLLSGFAVAQDPVSGTSVTAPLTIPESVPLVIPTPIENVGSSQVLPQDPVPVAPAASQVSPLPPVSPDASVATPQTDGDDEVLLSGPVHEAFAEQFNQDPVPGIIVPRQPPEPIEELPPDVRPDGRQVEWISGYWAWDDETQDFFWISGIWREVPQGFRWLPGYWNSVEGGFQWVSGTWVSDSTAEVQYLETAPPQSLELGPVGTAPTVDHIWVPGCWSWHESRYAWRPGYWSSGYANWIWVPARYLWTPRGYIYCSGYWDYPMARRGVLFAPNRFRRTTYWNRGYRFTPQVVIATNLIQWNFWVRPNYRHYYFGDCYGDRYASRGLIPWHQYARQRRHFDPLYSHYNQRSVVANVNFYDQLNVHFTMLQAHADRRPVRAIEHSRAGQIFEQWEHQPGFREQFRGDRLRFDDDRPQLLARTLQQQMKDPGDFQFVKMDDNVRSRFRDEGEQLRKLTDSRRSVESVARLNRDHEHRRLELPQLNPGDPSDGRRESKDLPSNVQLPPNLADQGDRRERGRGAEIGNNGPAPTQDGRELRKRDRDARVLAGDLQGSGDVKGSGDPKVSNSGAGIASDTLRLPPVNRHHRGDKHADPANGNANSPTGQTQPQTPVAGGELPGNLKDVGARSSERMLRRGRELNDSKTKPEGGSPLQIPQNVGNTDNNPASDRGERRRPGNPGVTLPGASDARSSGRETRRNQIQLPGTTDLKNEVDRRLNGIQIPGQSERPAATKPDAKRANDPSTPAINMGEALRRQERSRETRDAVRENRPEREPRRLESAPPIQKQETPRMRIPEPRNQPQPQPERTAPSRAESRAERPARESHPRGHEGARERKGKD